MASEDNFLRLDPYNFDTEEDYIQYLVDKQKKERNDYDKRIDNGSNRSTITNK